MATLYMVYLLLEYLFILVQQSFVTLIRPFLAEVVQLVVAITEWNELSSTLLLYLFGVGLYILYRAFCSLSPLIGYATLYISLVELAYHCYKLREQGSLECTPVTSQITQRLTVMFFGIFMVILWGWIIAWAMQLLVGHEIHDEDEAHQAHC